MRPDSPKTAHPHISALRHWLYCRGQCALIHVEQAWAENQFTAEGRVLHEKAHEGPSETRSGIRISRGLPVTSFTLGLTGQCDVVEFHPVPDGPGTRPVPVEYKRGKPKAHRADESNSAPRLALCLEEMLDQPIARGALYYGERRRRTEVVFDTPLRALVETVGNEVRDCFSRNATPSATYDPRRGLTRAPCWTSANRKQCE
ncbi:MAG: CRISPR-associated protein Cas4 [Verrucomicrobiales bacterium]